MFFESKVRVEKESKREKESVNKNEKAKAGKFWKLKN